MSKKFIIIPTAPYVASLMPKHQGNVRVGNTTSFGRKQYGCIQHYLDSKIIENLLGRPMSDTDMLNEFETYINDAPTSKTSKDPKKMAYRAFYHMKKEGLIIEV
jgi:hypothetical protein